MEWPFISIIVPTYGRPARLVNCLRSLAALDYPSDRFEVLVVDDGSDPPLESVATSFQSQLQIRYLRQDHLGVSQARNTGATQALGEFLAFTDDDCIVATDWLTELIKPLRENRQLMIGGKIVNGLPDNIYSNASQLLITYLYSRFNALPNRAKFLTTNNIALPKKEFIELGGFDVDATVTAEDRLFCQNWLARGWQISYVSTAIVHHENRSTLASFWHQQFRYGQGAYFLRTYQAVGTRPPFEAWDFYWQLLFYPFKVAHGLIAIKLFLLFLVSQLATVCGFLFQKFHQR